MTVEFAFGTREGGPSEAVQTGLPLLAGESRERIAGPVEPAGSKAGMTLWKGDGRLVGFARSEPGVAIEEAARLIYSGLLQAAAGFHLYRIWNLVPHINADAPNGLENYRAFCRGRSDAFEAALGQDFTRRLPAASALGTHEPRLTVAFLAGTQAAEHVENPEQVPAYEYPVEYGPRSPSFARATVVAADGRRDAFISGTSAVVGHATIAPSDTSRQLECTLHNLRLISRACGLGDHLGAESNAGRHFKVYLRNPSDLALVRPAMEKSVLRRGDRVTYLGAEICRSTLNVEIEAVVCGAASS